MYEIKEFPEDEFGRQLRISRTITPINPGRSFQNDTTYYASFRGPGQEEYTPVGVQRTYYGRNWGKTPRRLGLNFRTWQQGYEQ